MEKLGNIKNGSIWSAMKREESVKLRRGLKEEVVRSYNETGLNLAFWRVLLKERWVGVLKKKDESFAYPIGV